MHQPTREEPIGDPDRRHIRCGAGFGAINALRQIMVNGFNDQRRGAVEIIDDARNKLSAILAE